MGPAESKSESIDLDILIFNRSDSRIHVTFRDERMFWDLGNSVKPWRTSIKSVSGKISSIEILSYNWNARYVLDLTDGWPSKRFVGCIKDRYMVVLNKESGQWKLTLTDIKAESLKITNNSSVNIAVLGDQTSVIPPMSYNEFSASGTLSATSAHL